MTGMKLPQLEGRLPYCLCKAVSCCYKSRVIPEQALLAHLITVQASATRLLLVQVDVRALKQALWSSLQDLAARKPDDAELDFQVGTLRLHPCR